jgi:antitoxin MazE
MEVTVQLQVAKWGNSLAVRLPASMVKALEVSEGAMLHTEVLGAQLLRIAPSAKPQGRRAFVTGLRELHSPVTQAVARDELARY